MGKERSTNFDVGLQWKREHHNFKLSAFQTRFANYISLESTGAVRDNDGELLPEFAYRQVRARFRGVEAGGNVRLHEGTSMLDLELRSDVVRAVKSGTGEALPRIAPWRAGATLAWARGPWGARVGFDHFARQGRVPATDLPTDAYTLWTAALTYRMSRDAGSVLWYARIDNAGNQLAYSATSILTQTAVGKAPLPGRSLKVGLQANF